MPVQYPFELVVHVIRECHSVGNALLAALVGTRTNAELATIRAATPAARNFLITGPFL